MTLTEFLLARIAEDEAAAQHSTAMWTSVPSTARVLADCEAKRRIVLMFAGTSHEGPFIAAPGLEVCKLLALPYADHEDYREEWKP